MAGTILFAVDLEHQSLRWAVMAFLGDLFCLAPSLWCSGLTRCSEKSILEISQGNTDLWKTYFRVKKTVGLKISKMATNGVTKRINDTA